MKEKDVTHVFDAIIVGAGPAGSTAAYVLSRAGHKVLIIDMDLKKTHKVGESLPPATRPLLSHLGLSHLLENPAHLPSFGNFSAWGSSEVATTDFIRDPNGLALHIDRIKFDEDMLLAALNAGAHWLPGRLTSIERLQNLWRIQTNEGSVHSRYIIDASGRSSSVARKLGVQRVRDQELFAVYAWLEASSEDREMRTFIESTSQGWFYTSQLRDKTRIVGFHTDAATARDMVQDANVWRKLVNETKHIKQMIDDRSRLTKLHTTDASGARLEVFAGEGWIAAGDAALSFDPLSSQGIFNSIYTGMRAGESVHSALIQKTDFKDYVSELERIREVYSSRQSLYYSMEQRWLALPFWRMRAVQALEKGA